MEIRKLTLNIPPAHKPVDPIEVFHKLTLRGSIQNIWEPQAEALRDWHKTRTRSDVVLQMNTGAGKTLVGFMIAQSLIHELNRRVLYVVPTNQLVEQTALRAAELGLQPATRYKSQWTRQAEYESAETFCITNYASAFNGRSIFFNGNVSALIFDDAHVAEGIIRDQYTLKIPATQDAYNKIVRILRPHFANTSVASKLVDIEKGRPHSTLFTPMYLVWKHADEIRRILQDVQDTSSSDLRFPWSHLSQHIRCCCLMISSTMIEVSPPSLPLHTLPFFAADRRRIYLTATLPSEVSLARTFGLINPTLVRPKGKSGDAQRLFIFPSGDTVDAQRRTALSLVQPYKACVLSPSNAKAREWIPPASEFSTEIGEKHLQQFKTDSRPQLISLVARYDGIDFAGDSCRVLILDRLPRGESLYDRFIDEGVRVEAIRQSHIATRIVQGVGRIFRSNTDHGAVIVVGDDLQGWLRNPGSREYLPALLQKQVGLGLELSKLVLQQQTTWAELLRALLGGTQDWDAFYNEHVDKFSITQRTESDTWYPPLLNEERSAYAKLWDGDALAAATGFRSAAEKASAYDTRLAAWFSHLEGVSHLLAGDRQTAYSVFAAASRTRIELGRPSESRDKIFQPKVVTDIGFQASALARLYREKRTQLLNDSDFVKTNLSYGVDPNVAEEAMMKLGILLGLDSTRPDKSQKTGPDNLWVGQNDSAAWGFELKTGKSEDSEYSKSEIDQSQGHLNWIHEHRPQSRARVAIVGRELQVSRVSNPGPTLEVISLDGFREMAQHARAVLDAVDAGDKGNLESSFESWLQHYGLLWPNCVDSLPSRLAIDLRDEP